MAVQTSENRTNRYDNYPGKPDDGYGFIYFMRSPSGKAYVGQTTKSLKQRVLSHCYNSGCRFLYKYIKKYGIENFHIDVLSLPLSYQGQ